MYQDHLKKFVQLPVTSKRALEIAFQLFNIFSIFEAPSILQSDNGREFVNPVINELRAMWDGLKIVHGKPRHSQTQGSVERVNRDNEEGIKCSPYEAMFGQPIKVGSKTSNLLDDAIDDIFAEEELEKIIFGQDRDEQNDPTKDPTVEENNLRDITDAEGSVLEFQEETCEEDVPSTER